MVNALGNMSNINHCGYGYSKVLCEDITSWFVNNFFPRHKINVTVLHRGLKREHALGYCDVMTDVEEYPHRPRNFLIELDTYMDEETYSLTLFHELTHMAQWIRGDLRHRYGKLCYSLEPVENYDYGDQPHEIEARKEEIRLHERYLNEKQVVPVEESSQGWCNRLCGGAIITK